MRSTWIKKYMILNNIFKCLKDNPHKLIMIINNNIEYNYEYKRNYKTKEPLCYKYKMCLQIGKAL